MNKNNDLKSKILLMRKKNFGENELLEEDNLEKEVSNKIKSNDNLENANNLNQVNVKKENSNLETEKKDNYSKVNEKAFNLLANKFNESVEVILELNKRVEKLETIVRLQSMQDYRKEPQIKKNRAGIKFFVFLLIVSILSYLIYKNSLDFSLFKEILQDFSIIVKK